MVRSESQRPSRSSAAKYSSVATRTRLGGFKPSRCHSRQPSMPQCRMLGHSPFSVSAQIAVALFLRDRHGERDEVEPPPDGFIDRAEARLVITGDDQLEL